MAVIELRDIYFPDGKLTANWYSGRFDIYELNIELDNVNVIEDNAFDSDAFRTLDGLILKFKEMTKLGPSLFNNLPKLDTLSLRSSDSGTFYSNPGVNILTSLTKVLQNLAVLNFTDTINSLTDGIKFPQLIYLAITNPPNSNYSRTLAPQNFSGLLILHTLVLKGCGIETILEHTFDKIGHTLGMLILSNNHIKHVSLNIYWVFINSRYRDNYKMFLLENNLVECDCQFYEVRNTTAISFNSFFVDINAFTCNAVAADVAEMCEDRQYIHTKNCCLDHPNIDVYAYPYFKIKLLETNKLLSINLTKERPYRLWIQNLDDPETRRKHRCPNKGWLQQSVNCLMFLNVTEMISIRHKSELTLVCVVYLVYSKSVWPLHCITVRHYFSDELMNIFSEVIISIVCSVFGLAVGLCGWLIKATYQMRRAGHDNDEAFQLQQSYDIPIELTNKTPAGELNVKNCDEYVNIQDNVYLDILE